MAKDKRRTMSTNMSEMDLNDANVMTDKERESMQMAMGGPSKKAAHKKQSM